jgi:shikimate kinase
MQRIFLVGFMGAGKTTIGKKLASQMKLSFVDLDLFIENRYHQTISGIFAEKGEEIFRNMEQKALREVAEFEDVVIATGGGTPCFHQNMLFMNENGTTVYLKVSTDELIKRITLHQSTRPVLKGRSNSELRLFVEETIAKRSLFYELSQLIFNSDSSDISSLCARLKQEITIVKK